MRQSPSGRLGVGEGGATFHQVLGRVVEDWRLVAESMADNQVLKARAGDEGLVAEGAADSQVDGFRSPD